MLFPGLKRGLLGPRADDLNQGRCLTRQEAIDEAVRRVQHLRPFLVESSLNPSNDRARELVAGWVRAEYWRIMSEGSIAA